MSKIVQHKLLEPETHDAVAMDGQAREAYYRTTYDDGTTAETTHMLYRDGGTVRSVPLADWPAEQQALAARDAERTKHAPMREELGNAARAHAGKSAKQLTFPEMRDLFALFLEREGLLDADGKVQAPPDAAK